MASASGSRSSTVFINSSSGSNEERRLNKHIARKHVSKLVRRKASSHVGVGSRSRPLRPSRYEDALSAANTATVDCPPLYRNLPILSAALLNPQVESVQDISRSAENFIHVVAQLHPPEEVSALFRAFCMHPIIYHAGNQIPAIYDGILRNNETAYDSPRILWHHSQTLRLLHQKIVQLDHENIQLALLAVVTLLRSKLQPNRIGRSEPFALPFIPHMPYADALHIIGQEEKVQLHSNAVFSLVGRAGGLTKLNFPAAARRCAMLDLLEASFQNSAPIFPNFWKAFESTANLADSFRWAAQDHGVVGDGFASLVPSRLPRGLKSVITRMVVIDRLMAIASQRRLDKDLYQTLLTARNACHHDILSRPLWDDLSVLERMNSSYFDYEVCRIVAILYSNAVIFPVSPRFPWHSKLLASLRQLLQTPGIQRWLQGSDKLAVWALFVAGIAAFPTEHFEFFSRYLKEQLLVTELVSFANARSVLRRFIWSDNACEPGALMVWKKLDFHRISAVEDQEYSTDD